MRVWTFSFFELLCSAFIILSVAELFAQATTQSSSVSADLFRVQISTGTVIFDRLQGTRLSSALQLPSTELMVV